MPARSAMTSVEVACMPDVPYSWIAAWRIASRRSSALMRGDMLAKLVMTHKQSQGVISLDIV